jgi:molybdenum cofactor cytidylyltransferase
MNFGPVPVADAVGAILAHSVRLDGRRLRKGVVLTARDVSALARGGHSEVTVARLTPQDCAEDEAAQRLAAALVPDPEAAGIRLSAPFTGRVNIFAEGPCVARFDTARLLELNQVDPMITLATVPNYTQMAAG